MREEVRKEVPVPEIRKEGRKGRKGRKEGNEGRKERKEGRKERKERKEGKRFQYCIIELIILKFNKYFFNKSFKVFFLFLLKYEYYILYFFSLYL